ncbi:MAG: hypothetical protein JWQ37_2176 [Blastococcus sp.]|nr:hypothetical protein [Blastococcus sp.]
MSTSQRIPSHSRCSGSSRWAIAHVRGSKSPADTRPRGTPMVTHDGRLSSTRPGTPGCTTHRVFRSRARALYCRLSEPPTLLIEHRPLRARTRPRRRALLASGVCGRARIRTEEDDMPDTLTARERQEIHAANVSGRRPVGAAGHRPLRERHRRTGPQTGRRRALLRRSDGPDAGRAGSVSGDRGDRPVAVPRGAAGPDVGDQVVRCSTQQPGRPGPRDRTDPRAVPLWLGQQPAGGGGPAAVRGLPRRRVHGADLPRPWEPT